MSDAINVLQNWGLHDAQAERFGTGLINDTYFVTADDQHFVLQCLNPVFSPEVNADIDALTRHLDAKGAITQRIVPAEDSRLWVEVDGRVWRLSTYVPGICLDMLQTEQQATEAGRLLAQFHTDIRDLDLKLHTERLGVHDTARHLRRLEEALTEHAAHRYIVEVSELAQVIMREAENLPQLPELPDRLVHGDPKISNLVFDEATATGVCLIDLDTLTHMPLPLEMGDAFRSWCNPRGEDTQHSEFRLDLFAAAITGYAEIAGGFVSEAEWRAFLPATRMIMVELAARMATDALNESYFGWNPDIFPDRSTHNQVRAAGQLDLHQSLCDQYEAAEQLVASAFGG
jgi:Ser/Thr protein kinase RdoA (MazF antagonist)